MSRARAVRLGLAAALLLAAGSARAQLPAFTRTTTCDPTADSLYYQHGRALWWPGAPPTVTWWLYTGSVPPGCGDLATLDALTTASFATWSQRADCPSGVTSGFSFAHTSANQTSDAAFGVAGRNLVTWRKGLCSALQAPQSACHSTHTCQDTTNCWDETGTIGSDVLALTWVSFSASTGQISHADMELNEWNGLSGAASAGYSYTCSGPRSSTPPIIDACACSASDADRGGCGLASTSCVWADVGSIVTHEAGHVLGLDHPASGCPTSCAETMAPQISLGSTSKRLLSTEDVKGICTIYPNNGAATQLEHPTGCSGGSPSPSVRSTRSCGCGGDPSAALWALLGPLAFLRRRGGRPHLHGASLTRSAPKG
ncbi:MAG: matrixin family metalloprotease [Deltaproteobacteria bacterium]|nr:matrixin family metalloprotease [Deltaproteobacteria bacterium]